MKYIKQKVIKSKPYYYFEFPLTLAGKKKTFTRYLGKELPDDLKERMKCYGEDIASIVVTHVSSSFFPPGTILFIEKAKFRYHILQHELFHKEQSLFRTLFYILFVLNSNRAEGSKVTRPEIEEVVTKKVVPKTIIEKEIVNSINAINFAFAHLKWNEKNLKKIHYHLFHNIHPEIAGKYKKVNNVVANSPTVPWPEVPQEMKKLLQWFNEHKKKMYPPRLALEFYWRFEAIHPFEDGNGRTGRILLNAILLERGYAPVIFFSENHQAHCHAIMQAREGYTITLAKHYVESVHKTEKALEKYRSEGIITGGSLRVSKWEIQKGTIRIS